MYLYLTYFISSLFSLLFLLPSHAEAQNYSNANTIHWKNNLQEAVQASREQSKPILVLFTGTNWCTACVKLEGEVISHPQFAEALAQKFIFLKAEFPDSSARAMNSSPYKELKDRFNVSLFPTMIVIDAAQNKLFAVNYNGGGVNIYTSEFLQKLGSINSQRQPAMSTSGTSNDGYYTPPKS